MSHSHILLIGYLKFCQFFLLFSTLAFLVLWVLVCQKPPSCSEVVVPLNFLTLNLGMDNLVLLWFVIPLACVLCILKYKVAGTLNSIIFACMNLILPAIILQSLILIGLCHSAKVLKFLLEWFPNSKVISKVLIPQNSSVNLNCTVADFSYHQVSAPVYHEISSSKYLTLMQH